MQKHWGHSVVAAGVLAVALTACGGSSSSKSADTGSSDPTTTTTAGTSQSSKAPAAASGTSIGSDNFKPAFTVTVPKGWTSTSDGPTKVTLNSEDFLLAIAVSIDPRTDVTDVASLDKVLQDDISTTKGDPGSASAPQTATVGGDQGRELTFAIPTLGFKVDVVAVIHNGTIVVIQIAEGSDRYDTGHAAMETALSSWKWT